MDRLLLCVIIVFGYITTYVVVVSILNIMITTITDIAGRNPMLILVLGCRQLYQRKYVVGRILLIYLRLYVQIYL